MPVPTIGRVVIACLEQSKNNGALVAPAIITRVWSQTADGSWTINIKILADSHDDVWKTSVSLYPTEEDATTIRPGSDHVCWWPPRN